MHFLNSTHKLPNRNVIVNPTFKRVVVCNFHTMRIGRMSIIISVMIFGKLPHRKNASLLMQRAPGRVGSQLAAKGMHATKAVTTVDIVNPIRMPMSA